MDFVLSFFVRGAQLCLITVCFLHFVVLNVSLWMRATIYNCLTLEMMYIA